MFSVQLICLRNASETNPLKVSNISVRADGKEVVSQIVDLQQALCCLVAVYFMLDIAFPSVLKRTLTFVQNCIFELEAMDKAPVTVVRMQNELLKKISVKVYNLTQDVIN